MHQKPPIRIVINAKDVMNITGRQERAARKFLARIRKHLNKKKGDFISVKEFCVFTGFDESIVKGFLSY